MVATLQIDGVHKSFGRTAVLHDVSLAVEAGEFVVFVGPSGCGKSTLLRLICGLDEITAGVMTIDGQLVNDVPPAKRGIAMVFQSYALYPHMTVAQNMGYALKLARYPKAEIRARVDQAAQILHLEPFLDRRPRQLSGGQRQRVAIGRAIVREPRIFLFDEPLSNLDAALRIEMRFEIARLKERLGTTMIYVTHDQVEAMTLADRIAVMQAGRIEQVGAPLELYHTPANRFVAGFIGSPRMNFLPVTLTGQEGVRLELHLPQGASLTLPAAVPRQAEGLALGARPEHLRVVEPGSAGALAGQILMSEQLGSDTFVHVALEGMETPVLIRLAGAETVRSGTLIGVIIDPATAHLFDGDGQALTHPRAAGAPLVA